MKKIVEKAPVKSKKEKQFVQHYVANSRIDSAIKDGWEIVKDGDHKSDRTLMQKEKADE